MLKMVSEKSIVEIIERHFNRISPKTLIKFTPAYVGDTIRSSIEQSLRELGMANCLRDDGPVDEFYKEGCFNAFSGSRLQFFAGDGCNFVTKWEK